jgi:tetratricopeptide (TPR) repeat protein
LALADYAQAIELAPDDAGVYNSRGNAHYRLGQNQEAIDDYTTALELDPENAVTLTNRGDLYSELGYYEEAAADFRAATAADSKLIRAHLSMAWLMATCPDPKLRSARGAMQELSRAQTNTSTSDPKYLDILAAAHACGGNYAQARTTLEHAIKLASAEDTEAYQERLALYEEERPYLTVAPQREPEPPQEVREPPRRPRTAPDAARRKAEALRRARYGQIR